MPSIEVTTSGRSAYSSSVGNAVKRAPPRRGRCIVEPVGLRLDEATTPKQELRATTFVVDDEDPVATRLGDDNDDLVEVKVSNLA